eukprot:2055664-Rhodomonas_salina.1
MQDGRPALMRAAFWGLKESALMLHFGGSKGRGRRWGRQPAGRLRTSRTRPGLPVSGGGEGGRVW